MFKRFIIYICTILTLNFLISSSTKLFGQIPTNGLIAYYPFNGNANDESENEFNLTPQGLPTFTSDRFGNQNRSYLFNGTNDYFSTNFGLTNSDVTFSFWVNSTSTSISGDRGVLIWNKNIGGGWGYGEDFYYYTGVNFGDKILFTCPESTDKECYDLNGKSVYRVRKNVWNHIVLIYSSTGVRTYVNNKLIVNSSNPVQFVGSGTLYIGRGNFPKVTYMQGSIDDIRIYNRALNDQEVSNLYLENGWPLNQGLVAYYPFDGNADDMSGNGNDGITNGDVEWFSDRFGNLGNSAKFNNYTAFISVNNFPFLDNEFSLTGWIKPTGEFLVDQNFLGSFCSYGEVYTHAWNFSYDNSLKGFNFWDNRNGTWLSPYIINNDWVFVAIIYNQV